MAGDGTSAPDGAGAETQWQPPSVALALGKGGAILVWSCMVLVGLFIQFIIKPWFPTFFVTLGALAVAIVVHEAGHFVAARIAGMTVIAVKMGPLQIAPRGRGWKWRLKRSPGRLAGSVVALPNLEKPWPPAFVTFALGGVAANAVMVAVLVVAWVAAPTLHARLLIAACLCGAAFPLSNLLPFTSGVESDGLMVWRWWRHPPAAKYQLAIRALAGVIGGARLDDLEPEEAAALQALSPMHAVWYLVKRDQQSGAWEACAQRLDAWKAAIPADKQQRAVLSELTAHARREIAFATAIHQRDASLLPDKHALRDSRWGNPGLEPRCRAVVAWLDDDFNAVTTATIEAMALASESVDRSAQESERRICEALAATPRQPL